ncbi:class I SAM-dependent methyltransferase [Clostridium polynesiense]|uniref:class I SAM-dependent methyltransferase n=1 Tax=Clostridium polynesiense TaxID=1325933 RepID=UPI00058D0235|nr:class I SAM-dependent methyltransferase [Clostridium polynesiense]
MHKFHIKNLKKLDNPERRKSMPPEEILNRFNIGDKGTFLDVGCGIGYFTLPAAKILKKGLAIGIDISDDMLKVAKERNESLDNLIFKLSGENFFPVEDKSIDYVFISNVFHEVEDRAAFINEIKRVVKTHGKVLIIDWEKRDMEMGPPAKIRISLEEMKKIFEESDFKFVEEIPINNEHYGLKFREQH